MTDSGRSGDDDPRSDEADDSSSGSPADESTPDSRSDDTPSGGSASDHPVDDRAPDGAATDDGDDPFEWVDDGDDADTDGAAPPEASDAVAGGSTSSGDTPGRSTDRERTAHPADGDSPPQSGDGEPTASSSDGDEPVPTSGDDDSSRAASPPVDGSSAPGEQSAGANRRLPEATGDGPAASTAEPAPEREGAGGDDAPPPGADPADDVPAPGDNPIGWYLGSSNTLVVLSRDVISSLAIVVVIGLLLFAISGVWPPLVAIESGSMEPNMHQGDLVFIVDNERFTAEEATEDGIVPSDVGATTGHDTFNGPGTVVVFRPNGQDRTPIIHRAQFQVEAGENWVERADSEYMGRYENCQQAPGCPAPHDGYITKGDANGGYDQAQTQSTVVRPDWVEGKALVRVPYLGCIRLALTDAPNCW